MCGLPLPCGAEGTLNIHSEKLNPEEKANGMLQNSDILGETWRRAHSAGCQKAPTNSAMVYLEIRMETTILNYLEFPKYSGSTGHTLCFVEMACGNPQSSMKD